MAAKTAILIVNGGDTPESNRWIQLCLDRIAAYTEYPNYHLYVWNNRFEDQALETWLLSQLRLTLLSAASYEDMHHPHRTPLQRLYHLARQEGAKYIITMDSDAHPLRSGWLTELVSALDGGAALAGVWRAEMTPAIRSHVHASCLCTTVDFIETYRLRFDFDSTHSQERTDTLAHFTWTAEKNDLPIHGLLRSNQRQFHYWMGGIYGDLIYHHVAASRDRVVFHNTPVKGLIQSDEHRYLRDRTQEILFDEYDAYIGWLQGRDVEPDFEARMHKSRVTIGESRNVAWWLQRLRSPYLHTGVSRKLKSSIKTQLKVYPLVFSAVRKMKKRLEFFCLHKKRSGQVIHKPLHGPLGRENLISLARGWATTPPDFVGVGAAKSGTSWWFKLMLEHPQIVRSRVRFSHPLRKEVQNFPHFQFGDLPDDAINLYRDAFAVPPGAVCGEFSTQYLPYPTSLEHLAAAAPDTKIIVLLRNPIDRFISHLNHLITKRGGRLFGNLNPAQRYVFNTFSLYIEATLHSLYSIGLVRLFQYYDRNRVLILQYEQLVQDPQKQLARTYQFLGADDRYQVGDYRQRVNQGTYAIAKPGTEERKRLAAYYKEDVQRVFALCPELDPTLWPDFVHLGQK